VPAARFLIAWIVPFWLVLELMPTKLPHYILPAYPALALLAGGAVLALGDGALIRRRWLDGLTIALWTAVSLAVAGGLALLPGRFGEGNDIVGVAAAALLLNLGGWLMVAAWRGGPALAPTTVALALIAFIPAFHRVAPELDRLWLSRAAAAMVARNRPSQVAAVGYHEPSLVFLLGSGTRLLVPGAAADYVASRRGAAALVSDHDDAAFRSALKARGWQARAVDHVEGTDYSNGQRLTLTLYTGARG
jgi:4-amino-4-deoxy-L-arabinose transferase-like glycosyltransferase